MDTSGAQVALVLEPEVHGLGAISHSGAKVMSRLLQNALLLGDYKVPWGGLEAGLAREAGRAVWPGSGLDEVSGGPRCMVRQQPASYTTALATTPLSSTSLATGVLMTSAVVCCARW